MRSATQRLVILLSLAGSGCALNPATGERQLSLISEAQEIQLGRQAAADVERTLAFVGDADLQTYVRRIGQGLAAGSERPDLPWTFQVVDDPTPNAFALPGGFIYVTRGMLNLLTSEAELASVLGHEIAHVTARHSVNQISRQQLMQAGLGLGSIFFPTVEAVSPLLGAGLDILFLKYSRDDEREADDIGFRYVGRQQYAVSEFADVFATLERVEERASALPGWLSTHPAPADRVTAATARAAATSQPAGRVRRDAYLRQIDGLVYGRNPRHGFFRDGTFYHPDLRVQLQFPPGWNTQNLPQAVVGVAPNRTAAVEFTLARDDDDEQALRRFASQPGIDVGVPRSRTFGGLRGRSAEFIVRTGDGQLRGIVAFIEQRGRVYQIVGYSPIRYFDAASGTLSRTIDSCRPITDRSVLAVDASRIDIVRVPRAQTLAEFAERYPSAVSIEQLAVINHLAGASARLAAGSLLKRVVS